MVPPGLMQETAQVFVYYSLYFCVFLCCICVLYIGWVGCLLLDGWTVLPGLRQETAGLCPDSCCSCSSRWSLWCSVKFRKSRRWTQCFKVLSTENPEKSATQGKSSIITSYASDASPPMMCARFPQSRLGWDIGIGHLYGKPITPMIGGWDSNTEA